MLPIVGKKWKIGGKIKCIIVSRELECRKQVAVLLDKGWIIPSSASYAASVVFAQKADWTWCFCQDYRRLNSLNAITQKSVEPLPHVDQLINETRGARVSSPSSIWRWPTCISASARRINISCDPAAEKDATLPAPARAQL